MTKSKHLTVLVHVVEDRAIFTTQKSLHFLLKHVLPNKYASELMTVLNASDKGMEGA